MRFGVHISCVGRNSEEFSHEIERYLARIKPFCIVKVDVIRPCATERADAAVIRRTEGERLLAAVDKHAHAVALCEEGRCRDSQGFAAWLGQMRNQARPLAFVIGGAYGLDEKVRRACSESVSLSSLTFPHRLALVVLLEQIYRAFTILHGHPYHK